MVYLALEYEIVFIRLIFMYICCEQWIIDYIDRLLKQLCRNMDTSMSHISWVVAHFYDATTVICFSYFN